MLRTFGIYTNSTLTKWGFIIILPNSFNKRNAESDHENNRTAQKSRRQRDRASAWTPEGAVVRAKAVSTCLLYIHSCISIMQQWIQMEKLQTLLSSTQFATAALTANFFSPFGSIVPETIRLKKHTAIVSIPLLSPVICLPNNPLENNCANCSVPSGTVKQNYMWLQALKPCVSAKVCWENCLHRSRKHRP